MILGIAGTAKNTGKTTTTNEILKEAARANLRVGLTSIGYDGEDIDHVTDLPKPRVYLEGGSLLAVAEGCLKGTKAEVRVLEETSIRTPLGKILVLEVVSGGRVVVAGPNKAKDLREITRILKKHGARLILVDGALNRLAPMIVTEGLILATGASRTPEIDQLAQETQAIATVLNLPLAAWAEEVMEAEEILVKTESGQFYPFTAGSLLLPRLVDSFLELLLSCEHAGQKIVSVYVPGVIEEQALARLSDVLIERQIKELVLHDPIKPLVGVNPLTLRGVLDRLISSDIEVRVATRLPLRMITVNPFYPRYRVQYRNYQPDFVDAARLKSAIQAQVEVRVVDVVQDGFELKWIMEQESGG